MGQDWLAALALLYGMRKLNKERPGTPEFARRDNIQSTKAKKITNQHDTQPLESQLGAGIEESWSKLVASLPAGVSPRN
jgi:hypothetical protein